MISLPSEGGFQCNCYLLEENGECYIVDPGADREKIRAEVAKRKLAVKGILLTHGHLDHIGAIDCFKVPVYIHRKELPVLCDSYRKGFLAMGAEPPFKLPDIRFVALQGERELPLGRSKVLVVPTPGHSVGCVCYRHGKQLYTGDTLLKGTVGRWDYATGDLPRFKKTIKYMLEEFEPELEVYPGHGAATTIAAERQSNTFYNEWKATEQLDQTEDDT